MYQDIVNRRCLETSPQALGQKQQRLNMGEAILQLVKVEKGYVIMSLIFFIHTSFLARPLDTM